MKELMINSEILGQRFYLEELKGFPYKIQYDGVKFWSKGTIWWNGSHRKGWRYRIFSIDDGKD